MHSFITTNFQTIVRGAQDHLTGNMTSCYVTWPMNNSFLVSKHLISYYAVCNKATNTFGFTTCWPAVRLRRWLRSWYPARQRQRKKRCASIQFIVFSVLLQIHFCHHDLRTFLDKIIFSSNLVCVKKI